MVTKRPTLGRHPARQLLQALVLGLMLMPSVAEANAVRDWGVIANDFAFIHAARPAPPIIIELAYVHLAMYDAVNAIDGRYSVFAVRPSTSPRGASTEAATAAAAYTVLKWLYPAQQALLDATYLNYLMSLPPGPAKDRGIAIGTEVATGFVALRTGDGRNANVPYIFRYGPGEYQLTPGAPPPPIAPLTPWVGEMKTFAIQSATQFRADGPPALTSSQWAEDFNEVKAYGALTGSLRSSRQTEIGQFYAEHPPNQFHRNVRGIATAYGFSLADTARFYAQVYVTTADALITVWNSKYFFNFWRPLTAIRDADFDDNPDTEADPSWLPLVTTPAHPEYPAAHGAVSGGLAYALEHFFGTNRIVVTLTSTSVPGVGLAEHHFRNTRDMVREIINARVYGGMHYRTSGVHGTVIAGKVARYVARHHFQPVTDK
jgi:PAP2 superfamily